MQNFVEMYVNKSESRLGWLLLTPFLFHNVLLLYPIIIYAYFLSVLYQRLYKACFKSDLFNP